MSKMIKFPSIEQLRTVVKHIRDNAKYHNVPVPVVRFEGTVKLHGTNASVCYDPVADEVWAQSRENIITPEKDNAGFAMWVHSKREEFKDLFRRLSQGTDPGPEGSGEGEIIQIYGEWCGGSIQKGVGLNQLPKMFVVFGIRVSFDGESQDWFSRSLLESYMGPTVNGVDIFHIYQFPSWVIDIDFSQPELKQNELIAITIAVEDECPVAKQLLGDKAVGPLIGEGVVWIAKEAIDSPINIDGLRFKVKGEKHSVSKVKVLAAVDTEKVASVNEFAENVCTESRYEQMLDKMRQEGLDSKDVKNTGVFIKYVMNDIVKEELDTIADNGLTTKDIAGPCSNRCRQYYMNQDAAG